MALTKIEIAENLVERCGLDKRIAKQFVEDFFEEIRRSLESGEEVKLSGFGNFTVRDKKLVQVVILKPAKMLQCLLVELWFLKLDKNCVNVSKMRR